MFKILKILGSDLLNIFLPATCTSCGKVLSENDVIVCDSCYSSLKMITSEQIEIFTNRVSDRKFDNIYIMFEFSELFQKLMYYFKYEGYQGIAKKFATTILPSKYPIVTCKKFRFAI